MSAPRVAVIGAGPAGLGAAHVLVRGGADVTVFEGADEVGGLARSHVLWGHTVEFGAHLLLRVDPRIDALWDELIGDAYVSVPRSTRILTGGRWLRYPYEPLDVVRTVGLAETARCAAGALRRGPDGPDLEHWVTARFGRPALELFVADYVRKLLGAEPSEIDAGFAATLLGFARQPSLAATARRLMRRAPEPPVVRPDGGVGELPRRMAADVVARGGTLRLGTRPQALAHRDGVVCGVRVDGRDERFDHVVSTTSLAVLAGGLLPAPDDIVARARALRLRGVVLVYLRVHGGVPFADQWVYVTDPSRPVGRIANYDAWRPPHAPAAPETVLAVELGGADDDPLWQAPDSELAARAETELRDLELLGGGTVTGWHVLRLPRVQPVPLVGSGVATDAVRAWVEQIPGLTSTGRFGAFANTGVHESILLGMDAADAVLAAV